MLTIISTAIAILGIIAFYLALERKVPVWTIQGHTVVEEVNSPGIELGVVFEGASIPRATAANICFWNAGRKTIRRSDIASADPLRAEIVTDDKILAAKIVTTSRDVITAQIVEVSPKMVCLSFDFLDKGDGILLRVLHTGHAPADCQLKGTIKGVPKGLRQAKKSAVYRRLGGYGTLVFNLLIFGSAAVGAHWVLSADVEQEFPYLHYVFIGVLCFYAFVHFVETTLLALLAPPSPPPKLKPTDTT